MPTTILSWLAKACKATRENADITLAQVAQAANKDPSSIYRFEEGQTSPRDVESVVAGYATAVGVPAQLLWADAIGLWGRGDGEAGDHLRESVLRRMQADSPTRETTLESLGARLDDISHRLDGSEDSVAFEIIFRHANEGFALFDTQLQCRRVNQAWADMMGSDDPETFPGKKIGAWLGEQAANHIMPLYVKALAGAPSYNERVTSEGRSWEMSIFPFDTPPLGVIILATETTAQDKIAQLLKSL